jgi:hypothetical protein
LIFRTGMANSYVNGAFRLQAYLAGGFGLIALEVVLIAAGVWVFRNRVHI